MSAVIEKIRKLLELSRSSNQHEAAAAAARAADLMIKHQIEVADLEARSPTGTTEDPILDEQVDQSGRFIAWRGYLLHGLATAFGGMSYRRRGGLTDSSAQYVVAPTSAMGAIRYLFQYLVHEIDRLAESEYAELAASARAMGYAPPPSRAWKGAYRIGAAEIVALRLLHQKEATFREARGRGQSAALVVIDQQQDRLDLYMTKRHPHLGRATRSRAGDGSQSGRAAGRAAGSQIRLGGTAALGAGQGKIRGGQP